MSSKTCQICQKNPAEIGIIVEGKYLKVCADCKPLPQVNSGHARWSRTIDMEDNEASIQQPYNADGTINTRFAKLYPKQAKALFNDKQLRDAELR